MSVETILLTALQFFLHPLAWLAVAMTVFIVRSIYSTPPGPTGNLTMVRFFAILILVNLALYIQPVYLTLQWKQGRFLKQHGQKVMATVTGAYQKQWLVVNDRYPWVIDGTYTNPQTRQSYQFESEYVWIDPRPALVNRKMTIGVFVDPQNPERYYVDTSGLESF